MRKSRVVLLIIIVAVLSSAATMLVMVIGINARLSGGADSLSFKEFETVEGIIQDDYLWDYDMEDVQYAGLKAMVASLGDPYSVYYTPEEYQAFTQDAAGEYYGVGMVIAEDDVTGLAIVSYFFNNSAAEEAGIEVGDTIISIDGEDVTDRTIQEISVLCIGEEGAPITMGIKRGDEVLEFTMVRRSVSIDMLHYEMLDDGIGYMSIAQFGGNCEELFSEGMTFFVDSGAKGIVIDLRNNPGGYLSTVVNVLDVLLPEGTLVYTEDKNGQGQTFTSDAACIDLPVTLIVNGNTASAAEIFAGAVQDYDYGDVVGTTSYGKGVVQTVKEIPSTGGGIKITTSQYFTPNGRSINGNGIYPDVYVELPAELTDGSVEYTRDADTQIQKAIEVLKSLIG